MGPLLDAGAEAWLVRTAHRNFWKVRHLYDEVGELIGEGHVCWFHVARRYSFPATLVSEDQEYGRLMSLFKVTFANRIRELAAKGKDAHYNIVMSRIRDIVSARAQQYSDDAIAEYLLYKNNTGLSRNFDVDQAIVEASATVRAVLKFLVSEHGRERMRRPYRIRGDGSRETTNERLRRHTKVESRDLRKEVKEYLLSVIHHQL